MDSGTAATALQSRSGIQHHHNAHVEDWGPPPTFTEEDMRLHEASVAEQKAKKAAARAAKGRIPLNASGRSVQGVVQGGPSQDLSVTTAAASQSRLAQA